jgi:hypothetical protein
MTMTSSFAIVEQVEAKPRLPFDPVSIDVFVVVSKNGEKLQKSQCSISGSSYKVALCGSPLPTNKKRKTSSL